MWNVVIILAFAIFIIFAFFEYGKAASACSNRGGALIRSVIGYECVQLAPPA